MCTANLGKQKFLCIICNDLLEFVVPKFCICQTFYYIKVKIYIVNIKSHWPSW